MRALGLIKPEYVWNPRQVVRRFRASLASSTPRRVTVATPWGWPITIHSHDDIGKSLLHLGTYDLVVAESLWRLCDEGETALDLGANIGFVTSLLARRVGSKGRVLSVEAHPEIAGELRSNAADWSMRVGEGVIELREVALSHTSGMAELEVPECFASNRGTSHLANEGFGRTSHATRTIQVRTARLDELAMPLGPIGVAKIDVEGHEESVLRGGAELLAARRVRDWVFENHEGHPSPVTNIFESAGYQIFDLRKTFWGPELVTPGVADRRSVWEPPNSIATFDVERLRRRFKRRGWSSLGRAAARTRSISE